MRRLLFCLLVLGVWLAPSEVNAQDLLATVDRYGDPLPETAFGRLGTVRLRNEVDVSSLAITSDNKLVVTAGGGGGVRVWDLATGKELSQFQGKLSGHHAAFGSDDKTLVVVDGNKKTLQRWEIASGKLLSESASVALDGRGRTDYRFSPGGKYLLLYDLISSPRGRVQVVDTATGKSLLSEQGDLATFCFAADEKQICLGYYGPRQSGLPPGEKNTWVVFDLPSGKRGDEMPTPPKWAFKVYSGNNQWWMVLDKGRDREVVPAGGEGVATQVPWPFWPQAFAPAQPLMAATAPGGRIRLYDLKTGKFVQELTGHDDHFFAWVQFSADGKLLLTSGRGGAVICWDLATGKEIHTFEGHRGRVASLAFSPDGKWLASGGDHDGFVYVWDWKQGTVRHKFHIDFTTTISLVFSPDSAILAAGDGRLNETGGSLEAKIYVWELAGGKLLQKWNAHLDGVRSLDFSPDGKLLASGGRDCRVRLWDWAEARRLHQIRLPQETPFTRFAAPDQLVFLHGQQIAAWQLQPFMEIIDAIKLRKYERWASAWVDEKKIMSPDGKTSLRSIRPWAFPLELWNETTGELLVRYESGFGDYSAVAFSPDSRILAAAKLGGQILLYDLAELRAEPLWSWLGSDPKATPPAVDFFKANPQLLRAYYQRRIRPMLAKAEPYDQVILDLDSDQFVRREKAVKELTEAGAAAEFPMRAALEAPSSEEAARRLEKLLDKLAQSAPPAKKGEITAQARMTQAIRRATAFLAALAELQTEDSRAILAEIARGPGSPLMRVAARLLPKSSPDPK
jgi:WD40 repeat protein